jgi:beta-mannosidase
MFEKINIEGNKFDADNNEESWEMNISPNWELACLHNYNSTVLLLKAFDYDFSSEDLSVLKFMGIDYLAEVWLNWNYRGKHDGYFSPFTFNVSSFLKGNNILVVKVPSPFETPWEIRPDCKSCSKFRY